MKKKINVKPVGELELCFEDNKVILLRFDIESLMKLSDMDGGYTEFVKSMKAKPSEMCARIIYSACVNEDMTYEEARKITSNLSPETIVQILNEFTENMTTDAKGGQKELQKKLMKQFLESMNLK